MRIVRFWDSHLRLPTLGFVKADRVFSLPGLLTGNEASLEGLLSMAEGQKLTPIQYLLRFDPPASEHFPYEQLDISLDPSKPHLLQPVVAEEVWAAGVTYERSRRARESESKLADVYERVYDAERPEIFFKATPSRCVGPNMPLGIRGDTRWAVPEPELALILDSTLSIIGFTLGNDMSCRDIEGENPLYLPQAKVFTACCSLGPTVLLAEGNAIPEFLISCRVVRGGGSIFEETISTRQMHRSFAELVRYLGLYNNLPQHTILLTGTGIVPPDGFSLREDDVVEISSPAIGVLRNPIKLLAR